MFVRSGGPLDTVSGPWRLWLPQVKVDAIHYIHHPSPRRNLDPFSGQVPGKYISGANVLAQFARTSKAETASNKVKPSCFTNSPVFKADEASMNRTVTSSATIGDLGETLGRAVTDSDICDSIRRFMKIQLVDTARMMLMWPQSQSSKARRLPIATTTCTGCKNLCAGFLGRLVKRKCVFGWKFVVHEMLHGNCTWQ